MNQRPDPDQLLKHVQAEEESSGRGRLKLFFGASPGVGKTYAMLEAARQRKKDGWDVVVGLVETHKRAETEALLGDLEIGDHAVPERTNGLDVGRGFTEHSLGFGAKRSDFSRTSIQRYDTGLTKNNALALHIHQGVRRSQIDSHIIGKKTEKEVKHVYVVAFPAFLGNQFDQSHLGVITLTIDQFENACHTAISSAVPLSDHVKKFLRDFAVFDVASHRTMRVQVAFLSDMN
jgi:hypothetical protein